jgi:hypothetical protein
MLKVCGSDEPLYSDSVFASHTYTGNGSTQTITNGIDLAGKGGLVWIKSRTLSQDHVLVDTIRGGDKVLTSDAAYSQATASNTINSFNSDGYSFGSSGAGFNINSLNSNYVSWTFKKSPKFFDVVTYTGNGVAGRQIAHNLGVAPGMVIVKCTSAVDNWDVYHISRGATKRLTLNLSQEEVSDSAAWNNTNPTMSNFTVGSNSAVNGSGQTYVAYLFAHDTSTDGIIQCGSFTTDGSGNATVNLGWEPQYLMMKRSNSSLDGDWLILDSMRGFTVSNSDPLLKANSSAAEDTSSYSNPLDPTSTGFKQSSGGLYANSTYIYLAIRRSNKPPTTGTQVYNAIARTGTGAAATVTGVGFAPDLLMSRDRAATWSPNTAFTDKLRGVTATLAANLNIAEVTTGSAVTAFNMDGVSYNPDASDGYWNHNTTTYINYFFKRAVGVFDIVCYTGTGSATTVAHGLGVAPELMIVKMRSTAFEWRVYSEALGNTKVLQLHLNYAPITSSTMWNNTSPSSSVFTVGSDSTVNYNGSTYVAYLFATKSGISKVGSYTGNGSSQTIDCGFTTGARFFMCKSTSTTGSWWVYDSTRGIVSGTDYGLQLNSTAAEVTSADAVDPASTGIIVNTETTCNINTNGVSYIYLAFA